jgi:hypothetical protein
MRICIYTLVAACAVLVAVHQVDVEAVLQTTGPKTAGQSKEGGSGRAS